MWFLIDLADDSSSWWFYWPMLGTGIGVAITGIVLLGIGGIFGAEWERREIEKYQRRRGTSQAASLEPLSSGGAEGFRDLVDRAGLARLDAALRVGDRLSDLKTSCR